VDATDVNREQIVNAAEHPRVRYAVEPAEKTAFPDASFDLITVAQALHWFDFAKFWPESQRVLKPGGLFAAWAYTWFHISDRVDAVVERDLLEPIQRYWAPQNRLAWDGYRNVSFPFEELTVPEIQMTLAWDVDELVAYVGTWSATRRYMEANGQDLLKILADRLKSTWGNPETRKPVSMEFFMRVGRLAT
jgi:Methylase involved in ubiquinone/menaquinone biosynthesis